MGDYTAREIMVTAAAQMLQDGQTVFVGIGIPNLAVNLARRTRCPNLVLIYESGAIGARPARLPISIGDPALVAGADGVCSMPEVFQYCLQRGFIEVGFLGGAQIDRFGNLNTTVIGDYLKPKVRLPGSGGACEIAVLARKVIVVIPHSRRAFPERVDFITSPGFLGGGAERARLGLPGGGPDAVITDLGVLRFDQETREMVLASLHPGVTLDAVRAQTGWPLRAASPLGVTQPPSAEELRVLRGELAPSPDLA
ncbi:MAG: 3-oxoadipate--succinyl-CoA transferase subunit B [Acidobacteria bacterium RIFCSPHIGHO2_02_FULL_67_57]|nr:MAG: 3-oxoadipate--succinyl-CoA transferase subunit B [Acidobacteria bacterium RIFCSPHIGHO2_01_FULL_67_28]OFV85026.1 MAG: 3-oxoadipate--succinyl-CoA transferase subunit B [Acidobacteria bacterium RIFCSPHIGHO2_02_FULL_67_57]